MADFTVNTQALRTEAGYWADRSKTMTETASIVDGLKFESILGAYAGRFAPAYETFRSTFWFRCSFGAGAMSDASGGICEALSWVAEQYENSEQKHHAHLNGLLKKIQGGGQP